MAVNMEDRRQEIKRKIDDADMVLIGLGEAFQYDWKVLSEDKRYQEIEREIAAAENKRWVIPFLQKMILEQEEDELLRNTYSILQEFLDGKDYFIVSLCMDDYIYRYRFREERIVTPCGGFRKMQCDRNCTHSLTEMPMEIYEGVLQYYNKEVPLKDLTEPKCAECGAELRFNQLGVTRYAEEGYLDSWTEYTKWLQRTVNRRLCLLELGVGLEYPSIIRFPFEKIVFYKQKAYMYRIHSSLYQMEKEIRERGSGIKADPLVFLNEVFVK